MENIVWSIQETDLPYIRYRLTLYKTD